MLNQKRGRFYIAAVILVAIAAVLGAAFLFFQDTDRDTAKEVQGHIDTLFSLSGKLTPDEQQTFISTTRALAAIMEQQFQRKGEYASIISDEELKRIQKHTVTLVQENPELAVHSHGPGGEHRQVSETGHEENSAWIQEELTRITAAIEEVKTSNISEGAKEALLSVLEHRRFFLMHHEKQGAELEEKLRELSEQDPSIVGVRKNHLTGEYTAQYPNMLTLRKERTHYPNGTVEEMLISTSSHATDPEVAKLLNPYLEALETLPPWEVPPLPEHKDLRVSVITKDIYVNAAGERISDAAPQVPEDMERTSTEDVSSAYREPSITPDEVEVWREALEDVSDSTAPEMVDLRKLFEDAVGIPIDRFLEMTDGEIEAAFNKNFSPSDADIEERMMPAAPMEHFEAELRGKFSQERYHRAMQTLERYGPAEGIRQLKDVDPEMSTHLERFIQRQQEDE